MIKKFLMGLYIFAIVMVVFTSSQINAGSGQCQTYACHQAQQEIQYLYDAIWREKQRQYPNYVMINQAQARIQWLNQIK